MIKNIADNILYTLTNQTVSGEILLEVLKKYPVLGFCYSQQLYGKDNLTLEQHTLRVIRTYELFFENKVNLVLPNNYFKLLLALHDLGKPKAIEKQEYEKQHEFTLNIINEMSNDVPFQKDVIFKITTIINGDPIGRFLNKKHNTVIEMAYKEIASMADKLSISVTEMWFNLLVYFQCDVSGYNSLLKNVFITDSNNQLVFSEEHKRFLFKDPDEIKKFKNLEKKIFQDYTLNPSKIGRFYLK